MKHLIEMFNTLLKYEKEYLDSGAKFIAGIDEAGRGPLAGPVVVACVIMPLEDDKIIDGINDSKKLSPKKRDVLYDKIISSAKDYSISIIDNFTIDSINILNATKRGMLECMTKLSTPCDIVLVDAVKLYGAKYDTRAIIHGDTLSYNIAAASILAKVTRDRIMTEYDKEYPQYQFAKHKGYGTAIHIEALKHFGACEIHRKTFIGHFIDV
ncbi:MAG: ribonuclease HII, partial [Clostridia bacterium]